MTDPPGTLRPIPDPQAEMERLAEVRTRIPLPGIAKGDILTVNRTGQEPVTVRVVKVLEPIKGSMTIHVAPLEEAEDA